jgi:phosphoglycerol transferase MdoB-like AlkP superfamily enzyme
VNFIKIRPQWGAPLLMCGKFIGCFCLVWWACLYINGWNLSVIASVPFHAKIALVYACLFLFSLLIGLLPATSAVTILLLLLGEVNRIKYSATGQPLVFQDIYAIQQAMGLIAYASWRLWILVAISFSGGVALIFIFIRQRAKPNTAKKTGIKSIATFCTAASLAAFSLYPALMGDLIGHIDAATFYRKFDIYRLHFDNNINYQQNGLLMHLVMTGQSRSIRNYSLDEVSKDIKLINSGTKFFSNGRPLPKKIIFVLCESCWRSPDEKSMIFSDNKSNAAKNFRMISPVYGGGTPNAEFEVLTGLPARGLSGILYQEYGDRFSTQSITLASLLKEVGYESLVMHNFDRKMWRGDIVYPRLGFKHFSAIDEMDYKEQDGYPPDSVMYTVADKAIEKNPDGRQFLFLITMYSHGPYKNNNGDNGLLDFQKRLEKAEADLEDFDKKLATKYGSDYLMVVFADHRPSLTAHFFHSGQFPKEVFDKTGAQDNDFRFSSRALDYWSVVGDVPVSIRGNSVKNNTYQLLNGKPLYCLSPIIFSDNLVANNSMWQAMLANCQRYENPYRNYHKNYPESFYYNALFR